MFFKKKDSNDKVKKENKKRTEKFEKLENIEEKKFKLRPKTIFRIFLVLCVFILILGIVGHLEVKKRDKALAYYKSLNSLISDNYTKSNKQIFDKEAKTDDEKAYKELVKISKKIPKDAKYFTDVQTIEEYIDVLEEMKEIVNKRGGITITIYKKKDYKEITITEVAFDDAIRYANEKMESIGDDNKFFIGKPSSNSVLQNDDSKMIGFFINNDNVRGDGDSYYDEN